MPHQIGHATKSVIWVDATPDGGPEKGTFEPRVRREYPIRSVSRDEAATFVSGLDDETRATRFRRYISRDMAASHYRRLKADSTVLFGWIVAGEIRGLAEGLIYVDQADARAEIALTVCPEMRPHGIIKPLLARVVSALGYRGVACCYVVVGLQDCLEARAVCELGGTVDWYAEIASIIPADAILRPSFAAVC
jgi:hypothetical protein